MEGTMSLPTDAPVWRPLLCPVCQRLCGATNQLSGAIAVYCKQCRAWRKVGAGEHAVRHVEFVEGLRTVIEGSGDP
jgi:hypothetical protein